MCQGAIEILALDLAGAGSARALQLRPHYVLAHYHLGLALARQGRLAEAQQQCAEVLRLDPTHAGARSLLRLTMSQ